MDNETCCSLEELSRESVQTTAHPTRSILIVDADHVLGRWAAERLWQHGYVTETKEDAETAWRELQTQYYNLLITDNELPGLTGVGLLKKVRSACMPLPVVIAIQTLPPWKSADYPWLLKATKLLKPYSFEDLLEVVNRAFAASDRLRAAVAAPPSRQARSVTLGGQLP